ncbi:DUF4340 domain-containing protein [Thiothrix lacustris]|uniref:DUF4340 domain-containing protein n=1 Tax=Thiothrix lacustris TaxID=525917 RepID=UPI0027E43D18|nr:DUF4340 domain-containing protein [Thiothrix lacustris]WMP18929.1 hypothetical protein RCS87_07655 [Thiothrix lacustris]
MSNTTHTRRLWLNLALLLLVGGLGALVWWQSNQPQKMPETLLTLTRADITRVEIVREPGSTKPDMIRLERTGELWRMLEPKQGATNPVRISQLFTLLDETVAASYDAAGKDLKQYGLEPGAVSVKFNDQTLLFGAENSLSRTRYLLHAGKIQLVSEAVFGLLTGEATALLANKLIPEGRSVKAVSLPDGFNAKAAGVIQNWQSADALRVEAYEGEVSKGKVILTLDDGSQIVLDLLSDNGELVLANIVSGIRYIMAETQWRYLLPIK